MRYVRRTAYVAAAAVVAASLLLLASEGVAAQEAGLPASGTVAPATPFAVLAGDPQVLTVSFVDAAGAEVGAGHGVIVTTTLGTLSDPSNGSCPVSLCLGTLEAGGTFSVQLNHGGEDGVATLRFVTGLAEVSVAMTLTRGIDPTLAEGVASITLDLVGTNSPTSFEQKWVIHDRDIKTDTRDELLAVVRTLDADGDVVVGAGWVTLQVLNSAGVPVSLFKRLDAQPAGDPSEGSQDSNIATYTNSCSGGVFSATAECSDLVQAGAGLGEPGALGVIDVDAISGPLAHGLYVVVATYQQGTKLLTVTKTFTIGGLAEQLSVSVAPSVGAGARVTVTASVSDGDGHAVADGTLVAFAVSSGAVRTLDPATGRGASVAETSDGNAALTVYGVTDGAAEIVATVVGLSGSFAVGGSATIGVGAPAFTVPPAGGLTQGIAGTADLAALAAAQLFTVESVWKLDVASQQWQSYIPGGPAIANSLQSISSTDIVLLKSQ